MKKNLIKTIVTILLAVSSVGIPAYATNSIKPDTISSATVKIPVPVSKPVVKPIVKTVVKTIPKKTVKPVVKSIVKPTIKPLAKATAKAVVKPVYKLEYESERIHKTSDDSYDYNGNEEND